MLYPSLASTDPLDILQLIRSENVGPVTFFQLLQRFGGVKQALAALPDLAKRGGMKRKFKLAERNHVEEELRQIQRYGAKLIRYGDHDYPTLLMEVHDAPPLLMVRGATNVWNTRPMVGMVGSRNASAAGCSLTRKLARQCGEQGIVVVSGLARGIDAAAHQGALEHGTVGVIAGGIDNIYPPDNSALYTEMAEKGAIISENPFGATPQARSFPGRNRIIAGMCKALLVVEAAPKSGSLITARYGLEYNRDVLAIPGSPLDPRSRGTNGLIKQGALLIETVDDIVDAIRQPTLPVSAPTPQQTALQLREQQVEEFDDNNDIYPAPLDESLFELLERRLSTTPLELDSLSRELNYPTSHIQSALLEYELAGRLNRSHGGKVSLLPAE